MTAIPLTTDPQAAIRRRWATSDDTGTPLHVEHSARPSARSVSDRNGLDPALRKQRAGLRRLRWGVRAVLTLGVAASVAANILHAPPGGISRAIAAWPPLALLLTIELISRVPVYRRSLAVLRLAATTTIAAIAAWVSYWHMTAVAARHGETAAAAAHLLPLSVDGLVVVASISLVEIAGRLRTATTDGGPPHPATGIDPAHPRPTHLRPQANTADASSPAPPATAPRRQPADRRRTRGSGNPDRPPTTVAAPIRAAPSPRNQPDRGHISSGDPATRASGHVDHQNRTSPAQRRDSTPAAAHRPGEAGPSPAARQAALDSDPTSVPTDTAAAVAYWRTSDPNMHPADVATRIGRSERTVRRYWPPAPTPAERHPATNRDDTSHPHSGIP